MRVIRTEMYFDPFEVTWPYAEEIFANPGVSIAFFKVDDDFSLEQLPVLSRLENGRRVDDHMIRAFLDNAVRNAGEPFFGAPFIEGSIYQNEHIVEYIMSQDVVVERSPAFGIPFGQLVKGASAATIGTYIGVQALDGHLLLFVTVPAGILVVGSAIAVSKAIDKGLNKAVERVLKRKKGK